MARSNPDFELESTVDLDNIDEKAARALEERAGKQHEDIEVEEVPDERVAPVDRVAKPLPADDNPEPTEDELAAYSDSVRKRIEKLTHARHDERREKEMAQRERDEAVQMVQQALAQRRAAEERARLLADGATTLNLAKLDSEIAAAKKAYIEAADSYDSTAMAEAQFKMADLVAQKRQAEFQKESAQPLAQTERDVVQTQPTARPAPDKRAQDWAARNDAWFQKDKAMTAFAFGVHEDLVTKGVDPRTDAELYYKKLDAEMKARFPEKFEPDQQAPRRQSSPVAPATRTATGRKRVTLTTTEMSLARRLGVTPEQFAAEKLKLENRNG